MADSQKKNDNLAAFNKLYEELNKASAKPLKLKKVRISRKKWRQACENAKQPNSSSSLLSTSWDCTPGDSSAETYSTSFKSASSDQSALNYKIVGFSEDSSDYLPNVANDFCKGKGSSEDSVGQITQHSFSQGNLDVEEGTKKQDQSTVSQDADSLHGCEVTDACCVKTSGLHFRNLNISDWKNFSFVDSPERRNEQSDSLSQIRPPEGIEVNTTLPECTAVKGCTLPGSTIMASDEDSKESNASGIVKVTKEPQVTKTLGRYRDLSVADLLLAQEANSGFETVSQVSTSNVVNSSKTSDKDRHAANDFELVKQKDTVYDSEDSCHSGIIIRCSPKPVASTRPSAKNFKPGSKRKHSLSSEIAVPKKKPFLSRQKGSVSDGEMQSSPKQGNLKQLVLAKDTKGCARKKVIKPKQDRFNGCLLKSTKKVTGGVEKGEVSGGEDTQDTPAAVPALPPSKSVLCKGKSVKLKDVAVTRKDTETVMLKERELKGKSSKSAKSLSLGAKPKGSETVINVTKVKEKSHKSSKSLGGKPKQIVCETSASLRTNKTHTTKRKSPQITRHSNDFMEPTVSNKTKTLSKKKKVPTATLR